MSRNAPGRHRAPRRSVLKPFTRGVATLAVTGGMVAAGSAVAQAAPAAAPTAVTASTAWRTVSYGARGPAVQQVQRVVRVTADGVFGPQTLGAVKRWQAGHHLVADGVVGPLTAAAMRLTTPTASRSYTRPPVAGTSIIAIAQQYTGIWYRYGGATPAGFDCSGYTQFVYAKAGIRIPRTASAQQSAVTRVSSPRPGDLVFYGIPAYHVGIYAGNGYLYDSGHTGLKTQKRKIWGGTLTYGHK